MKWCRGKLKRCRLLLGRREYYNNGSRGKDEMPYQALKDNSCSLAEPENTFTSENPISKQCKCERKRVTSGKSNGYNTL